MLCRYLDSASVFFCASVLVELCASSNLCSCDSFWTRAQNVLDSLVINLSILHFSSIDLRVTVVFSGLGG